MIIFVTLSLLLYNSHTEIIFDTSLIPEETEDSEQSPNSTTATFDLTQLIDADDDPTIDNNCAAI